MVNNVEVVGLNVSSVSPSNGCHDVNVMSEIKICFNSDLNTSTIVGNFTILKDSNLEYIDESSLNNPGLFEPVKGDVAYENKTIVFRPVEQFDKSARYIVCVRQEAIKDILGRTMVAPFVSTFFTESVATLPPVEITSPQNGIIADKIPVIEWLPQDGSSAYVLEISKEKTFEVLSYTTTLKESNGSVDTSVDISHLKLKDGLYYVRVKSINGMWSNETQFFIKEALEERGVVSVEDIPDTIEFEDNFEEEIVVLDYFPTEDEVQVSNKINVIYIKVLGEVSIDDIDFNESFLYGDLIDEEDGGIMSPHGVVNGKWNVVYDEDNHESYIVFVPTELGGNENGI